MVLKYHQVVDNRMFISKYEPSSSYVYAKLVLFESTRALPNCGKALVPSNRRPYTKEKKGKEKKIDTLSSIDPFHQAVESLTALDEILAM